LIERLLENWLNNANERSFQIPFCHALAWRKYKVVHLSRHCAGEMGKDIIAIDPKGTPCAYQLKGARGGRLTLSKWRSELEQQIGSLVNLPIEHPAVPPHKWHKSFIVVNGTLDEDVSHAIELFNRGNEKQGYPQRKLEAVLLGELHSMFVEMESDFWATNLAEIKTYLELMLDDGKGPLDKARLGKLLQAALPFELADGKKPSRELCKRAVAGAAIICASAIANYTLAENHAAEVEAWTLLWSHTLALAERWRLKLTDVAFIADVARDAIYSSVGRLCDELMIRKHYRELSSTGDEAVYRFRMTHLLGLMGIYGLWRRQRIAEGLEEQDEHRTAFIADFCREQKDWLRFWGEAAIPQFLAWNFFFRTIDGTNESDAVYARLIRGIIEANARDGNEPLPNPYYEAEALLPHFLKLRKKPIRDSFVGKSWCLEALLHLLVRANYKQTVRLHFADITRIAFAGFVPKEKWRYYLLKPCKEGDWQERFLEPPHRWSELRKLAEEHEGTDLPPLMKRFPLEYLCFLCTVPYRLNASGVRWLSTALQRMEET
jgi:hypothetical protein